MEWKVCSTYFQQMGGFDFQASVAGELTYGLERLAMYIQGVDNVYDLAFNSAGVSYGQVFLKNEQEFSNTTLKLPIPKACSRAFRPLRAEAQRCIEANVPPAAYDQAIEASHLFNSAAGLRGVISVQERASYMAGSAISPRARARRGLRRTKTNGRSIYPAGAAGRPTSSSTSSSS